MEDTELMEQLLRLVLAGGAGMAIGLEREWREKAAGFRTMALVSLGSAAFVLAADPAIPESVARIVAGVTAGVGFLGAGTILRDRGEVLGLTTAAAVWLAAALGVTSALGYYGLTFVLIGLGLAVLLGSPLVDLTRVRLDSRVYEVKYRFSEWDKGRLSEPFEESGIHVELIRVSNTDGGTTVVWRAFGRRDVHDRVLRALVDADDVESFTID